MPRLLALAVLAATLLGCTRYSTRGREQYARTPPPAAAPQPPAPPLGTAGPAPAAGFATADEVKPVPPRPPETPAGFAVTPPGKTDPGVVPASATQPAGPPKPTPSPAALNLAALKKVSQTAAAKWKAVDTYEARLVRRETVNGKEGQTEEVLFQFRKEPHSVFMTTTGQAGKGRLVLYVKGKYDDKMQIVTGSGDGFPGLRVSKSPDDPLVMNKSRNSIRDAGFGKSIGAFAALVEKVETGRAPPDALKHLGEVQRPEYPYPLVAVVQAIKPGDEKHNPAGGTRQWFFDMTADSPALGLPVLVITTEPGGKEVEYYCFDKFKLPAGLTDRDFSPDRLDRKKR